MSWKTSSWKPLSFGGMICSASHFPHIGLHSQLLKGSLLYQNFQQTELPECNILVYKDDVFVALTSTYGLALVVVAAMAATKAGALATLKR